MHNYDIVFEKLSELSEEKAGPVAQQEATAQELDEIDELRRFAADIQEPEPCSFTTT
jgi:hypothetical protein